LNQLLNKNEKNKEAYLQRLGASTEKGAMAGHANVGNWMVNRLVSSVESTIVSDKLGLTWKV
jgi:hypothetical protein